MQIPILNGVYTDADGDFRTSYPRNLIPVFKKQGISNGYVKPSDGIVLFGTGPGVDRGGIVWNGVLYRAMGSKLVSVNSVGSISVLGEIGGSTEQVTFDYSFDALAVASNGNLFYWDGGTFTQVVDADLGTVVDFVWVDGYFMTTDGINIIVTELNDRTAINPLKYGSAEIDPDSIKCMLKLGNEPNAVGRYTIESFKNITTANLFPFQRIDGAAIKRGSIGTHCACVLPVDEFSGIAFLGGGRNEPCSVWLGVNGSSTQIATAEIDKLLRGYSESDLSLTKFEVRTDKNQTFLYVHLPDQTLVYDIKTSKLMGEPVWFTLTSSIVGNSKYRAKNLVWCYDKWIVGDPTLNTLGYFVDSVSSHYGDVNGWEFATSIIYNESRGALFHELELVCLTGNVALGANPVVWTSYSKDGVTWSNERSVSAGGQGERNKRLVWLQQGNMQDRRIQKFRGTSDSHLTMARLEARIEPLR